MDEFSERERKQIDDIYRREFQEMSAEEVQLLMRWNAAQAKADELVKAQIETMRAESAARIEEARKTEEKARKNLADLAKRAKKRLEAIEEG